MKVDYLYDYRNRLVGTRTYGAGALTASTDIAIDALDRPVSQTSGGATTTFAYTGTSNRVATETKGSAVKSYGYGAYGERLTITDGANRYSYLYNQHGDVSVLVDQANTVKQAYGYTAYGGVDTTITKSASGFTDPNPYRYSAKRWDGATGTYDMGARRYNPATTRWVQQDMYYGAIDNLGLSQDPLTANRYQFTGANPVNYVEIDGHKVEDTSGGGCKKQDCSDVATMAYAAVGCPQKAAELKESDGVCGFFIRNAGGYTIGFGAIAAAATKAGKTVACAVGDKVGVPDCLPGLGQGDNGCGPVSNKTLEQAVPDKLFGVADVRKPCANHDNCYRTLNASKRSCDLALTREVASSCIKQVLTAVKPWLIPKCIQAGIGYGAAVTLGGGGAYDNGQRDAKTDLRYKKRCKPGDQSHACRG